MKRLLTIAVILGLASATSAGYAQEDQEKSQDRKQSAASRTEERSQKSSGSEKKQSADEQDDEYRLKYDDREGRLKIEVEEEIRLRDAQDRKGKQPVARDGELELRYDSDRHDLKASGEGTIDVERAANAMTRWWQSWWEEEKSARRGRQEAAESGARHFVREHDENDDGYLSPRELPAKHRADFEQVDRNNDDFLSRDEVRRFGDDLYDRQRAIAARSSAASNRAPANNQDQTWAEWWSAWWSSEARTGGDREGMTMQGAREFVRNHDRNDDGVIMRSEMPDRMYDEFDRLDVNNDRRVTASELASQAPRADQARSRDARRSR